MTDRLLSETRLHGGIQLSENGRKRRFIVESRSVTVLVKHPL